MGVAGAGADRGEGSGIGVRGEGVEDRLPIGRQARQQLAARCDPLLDEQRRLASQDRVAPQQVDGDLGAAKLGSEATEALLGGVAGQPAEEPRHLQLEDQRAAYLAQQARGEVRVEQGDRRVGSEGQIRPGDAAPGAGNGQALGRVAQPRASIAEERCKQIQEAGLVARTGGWQCGSDGRAATGTEERVEGTCERRQPRGPCPEAVAQGGGRLAEQLEEHGLVEAVSGQAPLPEIRAPERWLRAPALGALPGEFEVGAQCGATARVSALRQRQRLVPLWPAPRRRCAGAAAARIAG